MLVAKVEMIFGKEQIPRKPTRIQRSKIKREVHTELVRIIKEEKRPPNVVANTITEIADKERKRAIRKGDYGVALAAAIIQYYAAQASEGSFRQRQTWN